MKKLLVKMRTGFVRSMEWLLITQVAVLTLVVLWGVFTRFCLGKQAEYTDELARVLLVWISMIGGALAFGEKAHLGVDYFVNKFEPHARKLLAVVVQLVIMALAISVFIVGGFILAKSQWVQELPTMHWLTRGEVYASIPLAGVFIVLFSLENLVCIIHTPAEQLGAMTKSED